MPSLLDTWRDCARFLRRPVILRPSGLGAPGGRRTWTHLLALQILGLALLVPLLKWWQAHAGIAPPQAFGQIPPWIMVTGVVIAAPIIEESLFRGWLTGRPRALWLALGILVAGGVLLSPLARAMPLAAAGAIVLALLAALAGWIALRKRTGPPRWFAAGFPAAFHLSVAFFALAHLSNYEHPGLATLPMVLPQLWAGMVLGYVRLRISLPGSMAVHACSNGLMVALATLG